MLVETNINLDLEQLKNLIREIVDERLKQQKVIFSKPDQQQLKQVFQSIDNHIWKPPSGVPSTLEMLQEDRNQ